MWTDGDRLDWLIGRWRCEADIMGLEGGTVQAVYNETKMMSLTCQLKKS